MTDFERVPVDALLGLRLVRSGPTTATVELAPRPELLQERGVVHGASGSWSRSRVWCRAAPTC